MPQGLAPLRLPPFRRYLAARCVDVVGNAIAPIALSFAILDLTGSAADLGLILAARSVPMVLLMLFGGVFADRLPRHLVMVGGNMLCLLSQGAAAVLLLSGTAQRWELAIAETVNGAAFAFVMPAETGALPQLVPAALLQPATRSPVSRETVARSSARRWVGCWSPRSGPAGVWPSTPRRSG